MQVCPLAVRLHVPPFETQRLTSKQPLPVHAPSGHDSSPEPPHVSHSSLDPHTMPDPLHVA
jgi:hypothetical protein